MINKVTRKEMPELFEGISEFIIEDSLKEHRRGSNFFTKSIIKFDPDHKEYFPMVSGFDDYVGTWETNRYVSGEEDTDWRDILELTRVEQKEKTIVIKEWVTVGG